MTTLKIKVTSTAQTDLALLVDDGKKEVWVPRSQIVEIIEEPTGPMNMMGVVAIVVPEWVAIEKGLQCTGEDEHTFDMFGGAS